MIIDMHMHEMRYSGDSFLRLENMVEIAKRRGLDGICITAVSYTHLTLPTILRV